MSETIDNPALREQDIWDEMFDHIEGNEKAEAVFERLERVFRPPYADDVPAIVTGPFAHLLPPLLRKRGLVGEDEELEIMPRIGRGLARGRRVFGGAPMHVVVGSAAVTELPIRMPQGQGGSGLDAADLEQYAGNAEHYVVRRAMLADRIRD